MAVTITPTNPGVIYDPRLRAVENWLGAVQRDLNEQAGELMGDVPKQPLGAPTPISKDIFNPSKNPRGFMPGRRFGHTAAFGPLTRIG